MRQREQFVLLLSATALLGCSTQVTRHDGAVVPVARALPQHSGKVAQNPQQANALSAAAVGHAQAGRLEEAIALLRQALAQEPQAAYLHNNLGYALLLAGRLDEAAPALQQALVLNPQSATARKNIAALAEARARQAAVPAPMPAPVVAAAAAGAAMVPGPQIEAVAPQVYALRDEPTTQAAVRKVDRAPSQTQVASPAVPAQVSLQGVRLEVSNGVGIRYLAKRTAERLAALGLVPTRLTNQPGYQQVKTEIQFNRGQESAADALAAHLPTPVRAVPVAPLERNIQIRLVLGHDLAGKAIASWLDTPPPDAVARNDAAGSPATAAGWLWS